MSIRDIRKYIWEAYSEPCQKNRIGLLAELVKKFQSLPTFAKSFILNLWVDSEYDTMYGEMQPK